MKKEPLKGLLAQTKDAASGVGEVDDPLAGPYSTVEETERYTLSDKIGREYTPQARGLTMANKWCKASKAIIKIFALGRGTKGNETLRNCYTVAV